MCVFFENSTEFKNKTNQSIWKSREGIFDKKRNVMKNERTNDRIHISFVENFSRQIREKEKKVENFFFSFHSFHPLYGNRLTLLFTSSQLALNSADTVIAILVAGVLVSREPRVAIPSQGLVLSRQIHALAVLAEVRAVALGEGAGALGETRLDDCLGRNPVGEGILAVLDDSLGGVVAVVGVAGLAGSDGGVVDQVEKVLSVASDDGDLLAVLAERIELVLEGSLDLLAGDVG